MTRIVSLVTCALLLFGLSGCTGGASARSDAAAPTASAASSSAARTPSVQMQVGTTFVSGRLDRSCTEDGCIDGKGSVKRATLTAQRVILFTMSRKPKAASVTIVGGKKKVDSGALSPGYTMPHAVDLPKGRYTVRLDAEWRGLRARWSFGLTVA